jgi:hypothetical protein
MRSILLFNDLAKTYARLIIFGARPDVDSSYIELKSSHSHMVGSLTIGSRSLENAWLYVIFFLKLLLHLTFEHLLYDSDTKHKENQCSH